jgi:uncharacterized integral membrane protein
MARIRRYYATVHPDAPAFFTESPGRRSVEYGRWSVLFTLASMVVAVNAVVGGATVAVLLSLNAHVPTSVSALVGGVVGVLLLAAGLWYERRRVSPLIAQRRAQS